MAKSRKKKNKKKKQKKQKATAQPAKVIAEKPSENAPEAKAEEAPEESVEATVEIAAVQAEAPVESEKEAPAETPAKEVTEDSAEAKVEAEIVFDDEPATSAPADVEAGKSDQESERRRRYRLNKVLGATLTTPDGDSSKARLFVIDISATGFRATNHSPLSAEEYIIEIILTKGQDPFKSKMRVVWSKELTVSGMFQMGCEFLAPEPDEKERLEAFIAGERDKLENAPKKTIDLGRPWTMIK